MKTVKIQVNGRYEEREIVEEHLRYSYSEEKGRSCLHKVPMPKVGPDEYIYENSKGVQVFSVGWVG